MPDTLDIGIPIGRRQLLAGILVSVLALAVEGCAVYTRHPPPGFDQFKAHFVFYWDNGYLSPEATKIDDKTVRASVDYIEQHPAALGKEYDRFSKALLAAVAADLGNHWPQNSPFNDRVKRTQDSIRRYLDLAERQDTRPRTKKVIYERVAYLWSEYT